MNYSILVKPIIAKEKGYVDHPSDRGGPTKDGITEYVARANGWHGRMQDLPDSMIEEIYINRYIKGPGFDFVHTISPVIGEELIDTGVNMGPSVAAMFFQRLLNAFNSQESHYHDVFVDGKIGPVTIDAFKKYLKRRGDEGAIVMLKALNHIQGGKYLSLAESNKTQEDFFYGWIKNRT